MRATYLAFLLLSAGVVVGQQDFSNVEVKAAKVAGNVYVITGAGGNIGVSVGEDGIILVDDQYAPLAPKIEAALEAITDKPLRFIINTHYHGDHTGGNEHFGKSAPIIAHENVRKRLEEGMSLPNRQVPPAPKGALPILTFNDTLTIHINGEDVRAVHFPRAHTDGDSVIWFTRSNVVHMGDNFFNGMFPFIDLDGGGSVQGMIAVVEKVASMIPVDTRVIAGHGPLGDRESLRAYAAMLRETSAVVSAGIEAGKSAAQLKEEGALARWDQQWGQGFIKTDRFIDSLYRDLAP
jgi:cyclase